MMPVQPTSNLSELSTYRQFWHIPVSDATAAPYVVVASAPGKVVNVWRMHITSKGNIGWNSSGGRVIVPKGGSTKTTFQYRALPMSPDSAFVPYFSTDPGEDLILNCDDVVTGFLTVSIDYPNV
jgi:hypothetical protein